MTEFCENCGSKNIAACESSIPGVNMRNWNKCYCCNMLIKREVLIDSP